MPTFDELLGAVRDDCDTARLTGSAELRRLGDRRTNLHRTIGGAAALVVIGGLSTGVALYGPGGASVAQPGSSAGRTPAASPTRSSIPATSADPTSICSDPPSRGVPESCVVVQTPPSKPGRAPSTHPLPMECLAANFDVPAVRIQSDDASGITGFDIVIKYDGSHACKLSQASTLSYLNGSGKRVDIPLSYDAKSIMVQPHSSISTSVFGPNDQAVTPTPPECAQPTVYAGLNVRIDGQQLSLGSKTVTLPCGGAKTLPWSIA